MELKHYALLLWRWMWLIALCTLLAGGAAFGVSSQMIPVYESSVTLLVNLAPSSSASVDYQAVMTSERLTRTYAEMLKTTPVMQETINRLDIDMRPEQLAKQVRVTAMRDTQLVMLTVEHTDPQQAARIANEMVTVFGENNQQLQASRYADSKRSLQAELQKVQEDINSTQAELRALRSPDSRTESAERERLQSLLAQYRSTSASVLQSLEQVRLAEAQSTNNVTVVEPAEANFEPVSPGIPRNTLLAAIVGAMLAVSVVFLMEYLDESIRSSEQAEYITGLPTLGTIGRIEGKELPHKLVAALRSRSPISESFRVLRANIDFSGVDRPLRSVVITSSIKAEGKTTIAANLAIVMAQAGRRVILVDTDLRRPMLHKYFQKTNERGFTTLLMQRDETPLDDWLQPTGIENLSLLTSGPLPPNPAELLQSQRMQDLTAELTAHADLVIFDTPPVLAVIDSVLIGRLADATLLVVQMSETRADLLGRAMEQLLQSGNRVLGMVLNQVDRSHRGTYANYYYYYYTGDDDDNQQGGKRHKRASQPRSMLLPDSGDTSGHMKHNGTILHDVEEKE